MIHMDREGFFLYAQPCTIVNLFSGLTVITVSVYLKTVACYGKSRNGSVNVFLNNVEWTRADRKLFVAAKTYGVVPVPSAA